MTQPRVSVLLPVRDAEPYLEEALASVLAQSFRDLELLVVDDGSRDRSAEIAAARAAEDARVRLLRRPARGLVACLREGTELAQGELLARMDADDRARPERLARQVAYLDAHPECVAVGADALMVDPEGRPIRRLGVRPDHEGIDAELLARRGDALLHPTALLRREALVAAGGYREQYDTAEDLDLFLRLAERGRLANLPEVLLEYRQHLGKVSSRRAALQRRTQNEVLREARRRRGHAPGGPSEEPGEGDGGGGAVASDAVALRTRWARDALAGGHPATARVHAAAVLRERPLSWRSWDLWLCARLGTDLAPLRRALRRGRPRRRPQPPSEISPSM